MQALVGAVVLAWLLLVVLAFAMAGLLRQLRDVQVALARSMSAGPGAGSGTVHPPREIPAVVRPRDGLDRAVILLVDHDCALCAEVAPVFAQLADEWSRSLDFVVLGRVADKKFEELNGVRYVVDPGACQRLDPGWRPALVIIDGGGKVVAAEPAGSPESVRAMVGSAAGTKLTTS